MLVAKGRGRSKRVRSADPETNAFLNELKRNGYILELGSAGHWKIFLKCDKPMSEHYGGWHCSNCGLAASTSASPSRNIMTKLRRDVENGTQRVLEQREQKRVGCS